MFIRYQVTIIKGTNIFFGSIFSSQLHHETQTEKNMITFFAGFIRMGQKKQLIRNKLNKIDIVKSNRSYLDDRWQQTLEKSIRFELNCVEASCAYYDIRKGHDINFSVIYISCFKILREMSLLLVL